MNHTILALILPLLVTVSLSSCPGKSMYKSFTNISKGDTRQSVISNWGEPHRMKKSQSGSVTRELWIYECLADVDCGDSECHFDAPCYILIFEDYRLVHIHSAY